MCIRDRWYIIPLQSWIKGFHNHEYTNFPFFFLAKIFYVYSVNFVMYLYQWFKKKKLRDLNNIKLLPSCGIILFFKSDFFGNLCWFKKTDRKRNKISGRICAVFYFYFRKIEGKYHRHFSVMNDIFFFFIYEMLWFLFTV